MSLQYEANLAYQLEAIRAVTDVFSGQENCQTTFDIIASARQGELSGFTLTDFGVGNRLLLSREALLGNIQAVQKRNTLPMLRNLDAITTAPGTPAERKPRRRAGADAPALLPATPPAATQSSSSAYPQFSINMETGTGKTYVYLRTIFELNKLYGFRKFVIVVPSIAIREGVLGSIRSMTSHFKTQYDNVNFDYFVYDSANLNGLRSYASADTVQIMIINIGAFNFADAIINNPHEKAGDNRPIDFVSSCRPIVIIDEPQSVDNTANGKEAISRLWPLCTLRYSATHRPDQEYAMLFKLDAVAAYEQKLVKEIEVASLTTQDDHNRPFLRLDRISAGKRSISAALTLDIQQENGTLRRQTKTVQSGDDLYVLSGKREMYRDYSVEEIDNADRFIEIRRGLDTFQLPLGESVGGLTEELKKAQIKKTIEEHFRKELRLRSQGIKVLSLFFVDRVSAYREKYAAWFDAAYEELRKQPRYQSLFNEIELTLPAADVRDSYFAEDNDRQAMELTSEDGESNQRERAAVTRGYDLIMRNKEELLSFSCPVRFIFSHSALKEGWDNPNVFQICSLNETTHEMRRRQMIGRGMRICVNQSGQRVPGFEVNTLTVMANETFSDFADRLQWETEEETGIRFGFIALDFFAELADHQGVPLGPDGSRRIRDHFLDQGYINGSGKVRDELRLALRNNTVSYPDAFQHLAPQLNAEIKKVAGNINIKDQSQSRPVNVRKQVVLSAEFRDLWARIQQKTIYRAGFDSEKLIEDCAAAIMRIHVPPPQFDYTVYRLAMNAGGISEESIRTNSRESVAFEKLPLPDILSYLQRETKLTRRTLAKIFDLSGKVVPKHGQQSDFQKNPQKFIEASLAAIRSVMQSFIVDGITYHRVEEYWEQWFAEEKELIGYLEENLLPSSKGLYDYVIYDSDVERRFAEALETNAAVKLYAKLPGWFKIATPLGNYNPDWAILVERQNSSKLYFVVETKGTDNFNDVPDAQRKKFICGQKHFAALETQVITEMLCTPAAFNDLIASTP